MAWDPRPGVGVGITVIQPSSEFSGEESKGGSGGVDAFLPRLFARFPQAGGWTTGLALNAPFGLETRWAPNWAGRYHAIESELEVFQGTLSLARRLPGGLAIGAGLVIQRAEARLTNAVDLFPRRPVGPGKPDGFARVSGDSIGYGYLVGFLWRSGGTRVGAAYHSSVSHELEGSQRLEGPTGTATRPTEADLELPGRVVLSLRQKIAAGWQVLFGGGWTQWHTFDEIRLRFPENGLPDQVRKRDWENVWAGSVAAEFQASPAWTLRAGYRFEDSPVPNARRRTPRVPDSDRHRLAFGSTYAWGKGWSFDLAYSYLALVEAPINNTAQGHRLEGEFDTQVHIFDVQLNRRF